jgi:hypothetical protein
MADRGGFIVLHRKALDSWLFKLPSGQFVVAIHLLLEANWRESSAMRGGERITIGRGQALISQRGLADRCGVARGTVGRALSVLEGVGFITTERSTHHTVVTIVNYSKYQDIPVDADGPADHGRSTVDTTVCTTGDPRSVPIRTREQGNKEQEPPAHPPVSGGGDQLDLVNEEPQRRFNFDAVYQLYPRKQGKAEGMKAVRAKVKTEADFRTLGTFVARMDRDWRGADTSKCPYWSTFVNQERWRDDEPLQPQKPDAPRSGSSPEPRSPSRRILTIPGDNP